MRLSPILSASTALRTSALDMSESSGRRAVNFSEVEVNVKFRYC